MTEYLPWSNYTLRRCICEQQNGNLPTLDLELTAKCSRACCIYCDSKPSVCATGMIGELDFSTLKALIDEAFKYGLHWVYTCGLGEPLEDKKFWDFIKLLKDYDIHLSMFSNGLFIEDKYIARELKNHGVNIILKMDTFDEENFDIILGCKGTAKKIYKACDLLLSEGYGNKDHYTDLAFSIVPTKLSVEGISNVIDFCEKNGVFASIGELEEAGEVIAHNLNSVLGLTKEEVYNLKKIADKYAKNKYMRPICPSILTGIHIDNLGNCIVDASTGLNCKWFLLRNPSTAVIGNIKEKSLRQLFESVKEYRTACFNNNIDIIDRECSISYVFGGCGGNPKDIINYAKQLYLKNS